MLLSTQGQPREELELAKLKIHSDEYLSFVDCKLQGKGLAMFCVLFCFAPDIVWLGNNAADFL